MSVGFTTAAALVSEVMEARDERGATLITSNLPFDEWTQTLGYERLTGALLDRITHHVNILEMNRDSYRLAQSRSRTETSRKIVANAGDPRSCYALQTNAAPVSKALNMLPQNELKRYIGDCYCLCPES